MVERIYPESASTPFKNGDRLDFNVGSENLKPYKEVLQDRAQEENAKWLTEEWREIIKNIVQPEDYPPVPKALFFTAKAAWLRQIELVDIEKAATQGSRPDNVVQLGIPEPHQDAMRRAA